MIPRLRRRAALCDVTGRRFTPVDDGFTSSQLPLSLFSFNNNNNNKKSLPGVQLPVCGIKELAYLRPLLV